ncbi:MAG: hypothetical protein J7K00_04280 [Candidatus Diapherotrites archaeon]|nr:hypothetical protein [Candidatus Diapherotrites archaeon]
MFLLNVQFSFPSQEEDGISKAEALERARGVLRDSNFSGEIKDYIVTPVKGGFDARFFFFPRDWVVLPGFVVTGKQVIVSSQGTVLEVRDFVSENDVVLVSSVKGVLEHSESNLEHSTGNGNFQESIFSDRRVSFIGKFVSEDLFTDLTSEIKVIDSKDCVSKDVGFELGRVYQVFGRVSENVFLLEKISPSVFSMPSAVETERSFDFNTTVFETGKVFSSLHPGRKPVCVLAYRNVGVCPAEVPDCVFTEEHLYEWVGVAEYVDLDSDSSRLSAVVFSINGTPRQTADVSGSIC